MIKKKLFALIAFLAVGVGAWAQNLTQYVDPYIGTGGHGHVFLGANVPYGLVQVGPTQYKRGWDWCSGYHDSPSTNPSRVYIALGLPAPSRKARWRPKTRAHDHLCRCRDLHIGLDFAPKRQPLQRGMRLRQRVFS